MNTDFIVKGDNKTAEEPGFNTDLDKAQVITKDEVKVLDAELHTNLLNQSEREKIDVVINTAETNGEKAIKLQNKIPDEYKETLLPEYIFSPIKTVEEGIATKEDIMIFSMSRTL